MSDDEIIAPVRYRGSHLHMSGYLFAVSCPYDGQELVPITEGRTNGWAARAIAKCETCHTEFTVETRLVGDKREHLESFHAARQRRRRAELKANA